MYKYTNPVIKGFHPDPSICRAGDDFYLVTSTFEYFPGVPVFHSKNLADWELIGHCLTRQSQLDLEGCRASGGVYAPTIRYHNGTFYMVTTDVGGKGHLIVRTNDLSGEWSEPVYVRHEGIDPSLTFIDGKVYFCCTGRGEGGRQAIILFEIDIDTGERLTEPRLICYGSGGTWPEAPHIYKHSGMYYLLMSEGGTEYGHMVTLFRSGDIYGPYEPCPRNPVLTHRNSMSRIHAIGHADLVEDQNGRLWAVCLGIRKHRPAMLHHLGREVFLAPASWTDDGWVAIGNNGTVATNMEAELPAPPTEKEAFEFTDGFETGVFDKRWMFIRNPDMSHYRLEPAEKALYLTGIGVALSTPKASPGFIGIPQPEFDISASVMLSGEISEGQITGITAFYNDSYHYDLYIAKENGRHYACLSKKLHDFEAVVYKKEIEYRGTARLAVSADEQNYSFAYSLGTGYEIAGKGMTAGLCTEGTYTMTFTGVLFGLYSVNGTACFKEFRLAEKEK